MLGLEFKDDEQRQRWLASREHMLARLKRGTRQLSEPEVRSRKQIYNLPISESDEVGEQLAREPVR